MLKILKNTEFFFLSNIFKFHVILQVLQIFHKYYKYLKIKNIFFHHLHHIEKSAFFELIFETI